MLFKETSSSEQESKETVLINTAASVKNMSKDDLAKLELQLRKQLNSFKSKQSMKAKQQQEKEATEKDLNTKIEILTLPNISNKKNLDRLKVNTRWLM